MFWMRKRLKRQPVWLHRLSGVACDEVGVSFDGTLLSFLEQLLKIRFQMASVDKKNP